MLSLDQKRFGVPTKHVPASLTQSAMVRTKAKGSSTCSITSELNTTS